MQQQIEKYKLNYTLYKSQNDWHQALKCVDKLIAIGPYQDTIFNQKLNINWCRCQIKIGIDYWTDGNFEECIKHMQQVINKDSTFGAAPYYYIGIYHWLHHRNIKAEYYIEKAVALKPKIRNYNQHLMAIKNEINNNDNNKHR